MVGYDALSYQDATPETLSERLETLNATDAIGLTAEEAEQLYAEITNLSQIVDSEEFATVTSAQTELESAEVTAAALESLSGDDALTDVLLAAANENRLVEYDEENFCSLTSAYVFSYAEATILKARSHSLFAGKPM